MNKKTISELRKRIDGTKRNTLGRKLFAAELRGQVVELTRDWSARGKTQSELAHKLGLAPTTLCEWLKASPQPTRGEARVRPVHVIAEANASASLVAQRCVVLPSGVRIEGLSLSETITLARALS
jgi:transposase-like protein